MATFDEFISSIRSEFGEQGAGKPFEVFCKWFLENDPEWSKTVDKVWLWDDYPNKWQRQDLGTDLVFRDKDGLIWAVQAKCYGEHRTTTKGHMDSFLNDMGRTGVDRGLWMQSNPLVGINAKHSLEDRDKQVLVLDLDRFRDAPLEYPASFAELYEAKVKEKPKPDPHQIRAIEDATAGLKTSDRGQMIMACGTGKTFTTLWIKEALEAHTTLVLLPSLSLLSQTMREWAWAGNTDFDILNVCSDKSVGKKTEDMDPADAPFPVTSEVEEITKFLKQPKPKVVFCTYQSSDLIAQAQLDGSVPTFDLAVADEAHRCAGKADAGFATILDGEKIRAGKRLFTTATPRYFGKTVKDAAKANDLAVVGMDDEAVFGPVIHKLTFGQAIEQELLTDYQVVIVGVDEPMVREWIENYEIVSTDPDNETDARTLAAKIGMLKAVKDYDLKRVISFHSRVAGAKQFSDELVDVANLIEPANRPEGTFLSDYVSGAMKAGDRKEKIDRLKVLEGYDRGILTNARCLAEGVDVPSLDGVAFIDPRGSQVEIIQAVGRAIRKVRGAAVQKKGTIVLPVFIEDGDDHESSIEASNFKPVWDVLKALRAHDEVLADTLDQYRTNMAKNTSQNRESIPHVIFDMPVSVDAEFSAALRTVLVEASTASWEFWLGLLGQFKEAEGHCRAPQGHKINGYNLGSWVLKQRQSIGSMSPERKQRLDLIGFSWDPLAEDWVDSMSALTSFYKREGHSNVKQGHVENGISLGTWCVTQRGKRKHLLSADQILQLNQINFPWTPLEEQWEQSLYKYKKFIDREGHASPKAKHIEEGFSLGRWVANYRKNWDSVDASKQEILLSLGFVVDRLDSNWEEGFAKLAKFQEANGNVDVSQKLIFDGFKLGQWASVQRTQKDSMSPQRKQRLDDIGFIWDILAHDWEKGFSKLLQFKEAYGHCNVAAKYELDGFALGGWVSRQRPNKDQMSPERRQRLNGVAFIWDVINEQWEEGFDKLQQFKEREGNCRVSQSYKEGGFNLGGWVSSQRTKKSSLSPELRQRLDDIGFVWDPRADVWEEAFTKLLQFKALKGHCRVPDKFKLDEYTLGKWVSRQRKAKDSISPERRQRLDELGFIWDASKDKP